MIDFKKTSIFCRLTLAAALLVSAGLSLPRIGQPAAQDELWEYVAADTLLSSGRPVCYANLDAPMDQHPHLYEFILAAAFKAFGKSEMAARGAGVLISLLSILAVFYSVLKLGAGDERTNLKAALTAALVFAFMPSTIQGGLTLQSDPGLLVLLVLLLTLSFVRYLADGGAARGAIFSVLLAAACWGRIVTPLLASGIFFVFMWSGSQGRVGALKYGAWVLSGLGLFLFSWHIYCGVIGIDPYGLFQYLASAFQYKSSGSLLEVAAQSGKALLYVVLWTAALGAGMFLAHALPALAGVVRSKKILMPDFVYLVLGASVVLGYLVVGGDSFGFPKYQSPGLALLFVFSGLQISRAGIFPDRKKALFIIGVSAVSAAIIWGDPVYALRYRLRELAAAGQSPYYDVMILFARTAGFLSCIFWVLREGGKAWGRAIYSALPAACLGAGLGMSCLQSFSGYQTNYSYGAEKTREAADYIAGAVPAGAMVFVPSELLRLMGYPPASHIPDKIWNSPESILERIRDARVSAVAYSIAANTVAQVAAMSADARIQAELKAKFRKDRVGSYTIWIRTDTR
jgi:4-amino-4-deoxy-L-arabinose transferase-like glycosyltransferase